MVQPHRLPVESNLLQHAFVQGHKFKYEGAIASNLKCLVLNIDEANEISFY
jgi:hypothetical protein